MASVYRAARACLVSAGIPLFEEDKVSAWASLASGDGLSQRVAAYTVPQVCPALAVALPPKAAAYRVAKACLALAGGLRPEAA